MTTTRHDTDIRRSERRLVDRYTLSPAQIVAGLIGLLMVISGGVASARIGFLPLIDETASVGGVEMTSLMGLAQATVGLVLLAAASSPLGVRNSLMGFAAAAIAFGAILFIEPSPFNRALGDADTIGATYVAVGLIGLLAAVVSPSATTRRVDEVVTDEDRVLERR